MSRYKAAALHLLLSALVLFTIFLLIAFVWYPYKLFALAAGVELLRIIVGVDLIVGPLIMLIIFDAKKKLIKMDVAIILICQLSFMSYGLWTMYSSRPAFLVFAENHFYLVKANEIDNKDLSMAADKEFRHLPIMGPMYVGSKPPEDTKSRDEILFAGLGGMGIQNLPKYFIPYNLVLDQVIKAGKTSAQLGVDFETKQRVKEYELQHTFRPVLFLPMVNKRTPLIVVVDAKTGQVVDLI
jgi:hypothetical protein